MRHLAAMVLALSTLFPVPLPASAMPTEAAASPAAGTTAEPLVLEVSRLMPLLPPPPAGWGADKPEGMTSESTGFPITTVSRVYFKGTADDAPTTAIHIIDSINSQQFQDATKAMWSVTSSTPQGYDKAVTVEGLPGFEHFANADQTGVLWVVAGGGRFFVQVETTRQPAEELHGWLKRIDLKALGALK